MSISYSWSFSALDVELGPDAESHTDIVMTIHWRYSATDEEDPPHETSTIGTSSVTWEEGDPWISYADLTQSDVEGWVEEDLGEERIEQMESSLAAQIAEEVTPTHETMRGDELPWNEGDGG
jgi:hypothetical protein